MLIFNTNIHDPTDPPLKAIAYSQSWPGQAASEINPYDLIFTTLISDRQIFNDLVHREHEESQKQNQILFPHASRFGNIHILNKISKRLLEGLVNPNYWYRMTSYHFCYLYDTLSSMIEEYSYSDLDHRMALIPDLKGESIDFNWFLNTYFFHTAFLIAQDRFNNLPADQKERMEEWSPCLFGVVNELPPSEEEIQLKEILKKPY